MRVAEVGFSYIDVGMADSPQLVLSVVNSLQPCILCLVSVAMN